MRNRSNLRHFFTDLESLDSKRECHKIVLEYTGDVLKSLVSFVDISRTISQQEYMFIAHEYEEKLQMINMMMSMDSGE